MTPLAEDIRPITTLDPQMQQLVEQVETTHRPLFITREGQSTAVLVEASVYEEARKMALLQRIELGQKAFAEGRFYTQEEMETMMDEWSAEDE